MWNNICIRATYPLQKLVNFQQKVLYKLTQSNTLQRSNEYTHIFLACFPKSGSSYLTSLLCEITKFPSIAAVQFYGHNEQDIYEYKLQELCTTNSVTQQHVKGTENNVALMKKYQIRPVILVRNIFDIVLSYYDYIEKDEYRNPLGYVHKEYFQMKKEDKLLYIIYIFLPWYFNFFISWWEASQHIETLWISYAELFSNQIATISKILNFYDLTIDVEKIKAAIPVMNTKNTLLNVGISGRGKSLPEKHKEAILNIARVWKVDKHAMEIIGIFL